MPPSGLHVQRGIWKTWEGSAIQRTMEGDEDHYTAFLLGTPSLQDAGCDMQPILKLPRASVVWYILHLTMAMGRRLLGEFVDRKARGVTPSLLQDVQIFLSERRASRSVYEAASPNWKETTNFF